MCKIEEENTATPTTTTTNAAAAPNNEILLHSSGYQFKSIDEDYIDDLRAQLKTAVKDKDVKGSILLSTEGINFFLCGIDTDIEQVKSSIISKGFDKVLFKENIVKVQPFTRMNVKIKKEIIAMGIDRIKPEVLQPELEVPHVSPETLKTWYENKEDMIILDTRNDYEVELGTFENAIDLNIKQFTDFPTAVNALGEDMKKKKIVSFCTGGVRCEKAGPLLKECGFENVYQLEGGILNYFEKCGGNYYNGECYVFDKRVAVDTKLQESEASMCFSCRHPILAKFGKSWDQYPSCPHCGDHREGRWLRRDPPPPPSTSI